MYNTEFHEDEADVYAIFHGEWEEYRPESGGKFTDAQIATLRFLRRKSDGVCFHDIRAFFLDDNTMTVSATATDDPEYSKIISVSGNGMPAWCDQLEMWELINEVPEQMYDYGRMWIHRATGKLVARPVTREDVEAEKFRRITDGFTFNGKKFQTRMEDRENIAGATTAALAAISAGATVGDLRWHGGSTDFVWIAEDNTLVPMDAQTMFAFGSAAMNHKSTLIFKGAALKAMSPIPEDYTDNSYWE